MPTDKDNVRYLSNRSLKVHEESELVDFEAQLKRDSWKQAVIAVGFIFGALAVFALALGFSISLQGAVAKGIAWFAL